MSNHLKDSPSLYLQQHANNPIDWHIWSDETWAKAVAQNRPVFLSVGYSSCHWCHVMAHESFENQQVADALNRSFISIKLDREEHPDIDEIYMTAVQLATGHGGWPMSVFLTPDKLPFFAGTYFPLETKGEHPGFLTIVASLAEAWANQEDEVRDSASNFAEGLTEVLQRHIPPLYTEINSNLLDHTVKALHSEFDFENGGFGDRPKFPPHTHVHFLMNYCANRSRLEGDQATYGALLEQASHMWQFSLERIAAGGIHDHIGGGFHRYSTDAHWKLPHFEKMLYDNGQLLQDFAIADQLDTSGDDLYGAVVGRIIAWADREMTLENDLFASSIDADSDGEEGAHYLWTHEEFTSSLPSEDFALIEGLHVTPDGNYQDEATGELTGKNVLFSSNFEYHPAFDHLLEVREQRIRPATDRRAILAWNSLYCSGLCKAGRPDLAEPCLTRWWDSYSQGDLPHSWHPDEFAGKAFLDDTAFFANALIDLYQATGGDLWLDRASQVADYLQTNFALPSGGFAYTNHKADPLIGRTVPCLDQAIPSPNGIAIRALRRLGRIEESRKHLTAVAGWAQRLPTSCTTLIEECLEHLLVAGQPIAIESKRAARPEVDVTLEPATVPVDKTGRGETKLIIRIPNGYHINAFQPPAAWLTPTSVEIIGVYGEAQVEANPENGITHLLEVPLRLTQKGAQTEFQVKVTTQLCSDSECYEPRTIFLEGSLVNLDVSET